MGSLVDAGRIRRHMGGGCDQPFMPPAAAIPRGTPFFQGGYVEVWYFLTNDNRSFNKQYGVPANTSPLENAYWVKSCSGCCSGWGAWQVGARYNAVDLNDNGINGGILNSFTFGVNWFLNPNAKMQFNYDFTNRSKVKTVATGDINGSVHASSTVSYADEGGDERSLISSRASLARCCA